MFRRQGKEAGGKSRKECSLGRKTSMSKSLTKNMARGTDYRKKMLACLGEMAGRGDEGGMLLGPGIIESYGT